MTSLSDSSEWDRIIFWGDDENDIPRGLEGRGGTGEVARRREDCNGVSLRNAGVADLAGVTGLDPGGMAVEELRMWEPNRERLLWALGTL